MYVILINSLSLYLGSFYMFCSSREPRRIHLLVFIEHWAKELVDQKTFSSEKELWLRGDGEASQDKVYVRHSLKGCLCLSQSTPGCLGLCPQVCSLEQEWLQALPLLMEREPRVSLGLMLTYILLTGCGRCWSDWKGSVSSKPWTE